jgi:hypothetical protein
MSIIGDLQSKFGIIDDNDLPDQRGVRSVPFEPFLYLVERSGFTGLERVSADLVRLWLTHYKRVPGAQKQKHMTACVELILINLLRAEARSEGLAVGISTSKQRLDASRRYRPSFMTVDYFLKARDLLLDQGMITIAYPGYQNAGLAQVARYKLTDLAKSQLLAIKPTREAFRVGNQTEAIILKDTEGRLAKYKDDHRTNAMRNRLSRINDTILTAHIGSTRPLAPELDLEEGQSLGKSNLYRIFNNGDFEQGGRFYGGWWQHAKRHFRPLITMNDEATVEADYRGLHPSMLFAKRGLPIPEDPYALIPGVHGDAILRDHAKTTFLALVNAGQRSTREPRDFDGTQHGMSGKDFRALVSGAFPMLPDIFGSGIGLRLQREDSDLAEKVMMHFVDRGIPILPIHDSFIVAKRHQKELVDVMLAAFKDGYGQEISVTVKG